MAQVLSLGLKLTPVYRKWNFLIEWWTLLLTLKSRESWIKEKMTLKTP